MSKENETTITKRELLQFIEATVTSTIGAQQVSRTQVVKETSILHYFNIVDKGKEFLRSTADLGLAIVDGGLAIPVSLINSEIVIPSLNCNSIEKWLWPDESQEQSVVLEEKQ